MKDLRASLEYKRFRQDLLSNQPSYIKKGNVPSAYIQDGKVHLKEDLSKKAGYARVDDGNGHVIVTWMENGAMMVWSPAAQILLPEDSSELFHYMYNLTGIDADLFSFEQVKNASAMFFECPKLTRVCVCDGREVETGTSMFEHCSSLEEVVIPNKHSSKLLDAKYMFAHCTNLRSVDLSNATVSRDCVTDHMFDDCPKLTECKPFTEKPKRTDIHFDDLLAVSNLSKLTMREEAEFKYEAKHRTAGDIMKWFQKIEDKSGRNIINHAKLENLLS